MCALAGGVGARSLGAGYVAGNDIGHAVLARLGWLGSGGGGVELADSDEVVGGGFDFEPGPVSFGANESEFATGANGFDPPEGFLDAFADPLGNAITGVAGGAPINGGSSPFVVLGDVRREPQLPRVSDKGFGVIALIRGNGPTPFPLWEPSEHVRGAITFRVASRGGQLRVNDQTVAMLDHQMPHIRQLRGGVVRLTKQQRVGI